jgi:hypothetical protein
MYWKHYTIMWWTQPTHGVPIEFWQLSIVIFDCIYGIIGSLITAPSVIVCPESTYNACITGVTSFFDRWFLNICGIRTFVGPVFSSYFTIDINTGYPITAYTFGTNLAFDFCCSVGSNSVIVTFAGRRAACDITTIVICPGNNCGSRDRVIAVIVSTAFVSVGFIFTTGTGSIITSRCRAPIITRIRGFLVTCTDCNTTSTSSLFTRAISLTGPAAHPTTFGTDCTSCVFNPIDRGIIYAFDIVNSRSGSTDKRDHPQRCTSIEHTATYPGNGFTNSHITTTYFTIKCFATSSATTSRSTFVAKC